MSSTTAEEDQVALPSIGQRPSRMDAAYLSLKQAILKGELEPGTQLKEKVLGEQLGISATPIREALARLEQEYLARSVPYQGTFVMGLSQDDISQIYDVRQALEGWTIESIAPAITDKVLAELDALLASEGVAIGKGHYAVHLDTDIQFHRTILEAAGNEWLARVSRWFSDHMYRIRSLLGPIPQDHVEQAFTEHIGILNALKAHDAPKARAVMDEHLKRAGRRSADLLLAARGKQDSGG